MESNIPKPMTGTEIVLDVVGRKYASGAKLTITEQNLAITASATENSKRYGPGLAEFEVSKPDLPETVKGSLAKHSA